MQSRLRLAGHGVQPLLLMFPLGLFWTAFVFDLATLLGAPALIGTVAFWNLVAGLGGGVLAALAAVFDAVSADTPTAARVFCLALLLDVGVLIAFAVLALMRVRDPDRTVNAGLLAVEAGGLAAVLFSAWFGGRLGHPGAPVADRRPPRPATGPAPGPPVTAVRHTAGRPSAAGRAAVPQRHPAAAPPPSSRAGGRTAVSQRPPVVDPPPPYQAGGRAAVPQRTPAATPPPSSRTGGRTDVPQRTSAATPSPSSRAGGPAAVPRPAAVAPDPGDPRVSAQARARQAATFRRPPSSFLVG
jgi:uncharacterized membrane protein